MDALAYWVISDHFEELGRPPRLFHNGFGLLTVGNLRKPRYWAVHLAAHLGDQVLATELTGDGAEVLVRAWATKHADGTIDVLVWNGTINGAVMDGDPRLDRDVQHLARAPRAQRLQVRLARVDQHHSNIVASCPSDIEWPDAALWQSLHAQDHLHEEPLDAVAAGQTSAHFDIALPMPGVARVRLTPVATHARERRFAMMRRSVLRGGASRPRWPWPLAGLAACAGANQNGALKGGSSILTIQGDAGDPTLTENFNPFSSVQLEGTRLIYEPLEIPSSVNGSYTPFLATGFAFSNPTTLTYTLRNNVKWSDGQPFSAADVVFTFNLLKKFPALDTTGVWTQLKSRHQFGQHSDDDVQDAQRAVRRDDRAGADRARNTSGASIADPAKNTNTASRRHWAVRPRDVRADPVPVQEEHLVLECHPDRAARR